MRIQPDRPSQILSGLLELCDLEACPQLVLLALPHSTGACRTRPSVHLGTHPSIHLLGELSGLEWGGNANTTRPLLPRLTVQLERQERCKKCLEGHAASCLSDQLYSPVKAQFRWHLPQEAFLNLLLSEQKVSLLPLNPTETPDDGGLAPSMTTSRSQETARVAVRRAAFTSVRRQMNG